MIFEYFGVLIEKSGFILLFIWKEITATVTYLPLRFIRYKRIIRFVHNVLMPFTLLVQKPLSVNTSTQYHSSHWNQYRRCRCRGQCQWAIRPTEHHSAAKTRSKRPETNVCSPPIDFPSDTVSKEALRMTQNRFLFHIELCAQKKRRFLDGSFDMYEKTSC